MGTIGGQFKAFFMFLVVLAVTINFVIVPMTDDIGEQQGTISIGLVEATNTTGNTTSQYSPTKVGLFGDPESQLNTILLILGVAGGIAAIAIFGTGAQPGPAAVVAFLVALVLIMINVLIAMKDTIEGVPFIGTPAFVIITAITTVLALYVAAGFMASGSAQ